MPSDIRIHDKIFTPYISHDEILEKVRFLAGKVLQDAGEETPVFIVVLKGSFMFASDFLKAFEKDAVIDFIRIKSYEGTTSTGKTEVLLDVTEKLQGKKVYILEDIVDTGNTLKIVLELVQKHQPGQLKIVSLFYKPEAYKYDYPIDFVGFEIPNRFIVGYGLDYNELGRNLKNIYQLKI